MSFLDNLVDKAYRGKSANELLKAPVSALKGVSKSDEQYLIAALGIRTIGDLASHWSVQRAQSIVSGTTLMETPLNAHVVATASDASTEVTPDKWSNTMDALLSGGVGVSSLQGAWVNLQVYCYYGLNLPTDENSLKISLKTDDLSLLGTPIVQGITSNNKTLHDTCKNFLNNVYNKVVDLGQHLKNFADDAKSDGDDSIFQAILTMLDQDDKESVLALLEDRIQQSETNAAAASDILDNLASFKTDLTSSRDGLKGIKGLIDQNEDLNQDKINQLLGGAEVAGSIEDLRAKLKDAQDDYSYDVTVAATTPTYAWVFPYGTISAVVVAGVYGKRATDDLDNIHEYQKRLQAAQQELRTAQMTLHLQELAETGVDGTIQYTNTAIMCTTTLQNSWQTMKGDLETIRDSLQKTVKNNDGNSQLNVKALVKTYVNKSKKAWEDLSPMIDELMKNAFINEPEKMEWEDFEKQIEEHVANG